jgi:methionine-rich copper-binding protein CopC
MSRIARLLGVCVASIAVALTVVLTTAGGSALAHSEVEFTIPAEGEQVATPVSQITVAFNESVTLIGDGFEVLTPAGRVEQPVITTEDGAVYVLALSTPLAGGDVGVRYEVAAADGHVIDGGFSFTVLAPADAAPVPSTLPIPPTVAPSTLPIPPTVAPSTTAPTSPSVPAVTSAGSADTSEPPATPVATSVPTSLIAAPGDGGDGGDDSGSALGQILGLLGGFVIAGAVFVVVRSWMRRL